MEEFEADFDAVWDRGAYTASDRVEFKRYRDGWWRDVGHIAKPMTRAAREAAVDAWLNKGQLPADCIHSGDAAKG